MSLNLLCLPSHFFNPLAYTGLINLFLRDSSFLICSLFISEFKDAMAKSIVLGLNTGTLLEAYISSLYVLVEENNESIDLNECLELRVENNFALNNNFLNCMNKMRMAPRQEIQSNSKGKRRKE